MRRRVVVTLAAGAALALVPPARAHTQVATTFPLDQDVVAASPARVAVRFNEEIETGLSRVRVYDERGRRVDRGRTRARGEDGVAVALRPSLPRGTYTVSWRIVADDGHAERGAFVFHVRVPGSNPAGVLPRVLAPERHGGVDAAAVLLRFVVFALLLLAVGGAAAGAFVLRDAAAPRAVSAVAVALAAAALARLVVETAAAGDLSLREAATRDVLSIVLRSRFGWGSTATAVGALALAALARTRLALVAAAALVVLPAAMGHAVEAGPAAVAADAVHVEAAAVWVGGLAFVLVVLARAPARWELAARIVPRFSAAAVVQVPLLVAAGTVSAWLEVRAWSPLVRTTYGQLVLAKIALVVALLALGLVNRLAVPQLAQARPRRRFVRATAGETVLFVAVLAVTAVLVGKPPGRLAAAEAAEARAAGPYQAALETRALRFELRVDPARAGPNRVTLYANERSGAPVGGIASLAAVPTGGERPPLRARARSILPGQYVFRVRPRVETTWLLTFVLRRAGAAPATATFQVPIGSNH